MLLLSKLADRLLRSWLLGNLSCVAESTQSHMCMYVFVSYLFTEDHLDYTMQDLPVFTTYVGHHVMHYVTYP